MTTAISRGPAPGRGLVRGIFDLRRMRVRILYRWRHGRWPDLDAPELFTEWVQWRKLNDSSLAMASLTDKLRSKAVAAAACGPDLCIPTLWAGEHLPRDPPASLPLVVKPNHGCGQFVVVRSAADWQRARTASQQWLHTAYGEWLDERHYRAARRLILVEPFVGGCVDGLPDDYKVYVFDGRAAIVQHHVGRGTGAHRWTQFDRSWRRVGGHPSAAAAPETLEAMLKSAERLAGGADFLRVDFYEAGGRLWFGEFCLFPGSGLDPFEPVELDRWLGALWSRAKARTPAI